MRTSDSVAGATSAIRRLAMITSTAHRTVAAITSTSPDPASKCPFDKDSATSPPMSRAMAPMFQPVTRS
jgi:hypothetical protein